MTKSLSGYEHADSVLNDLQASKLHEKQKERQIRSARNIDPPNFRPLMKRKYSSGKLSNLNNSKTDDDIDINSISPTTSSSNNRRREESTFEFKQNDHPDDESSTFIRAKTFILVRYIKQFILPCYSRIRHLYYRIEHFIRSRIDIKKIGLVILVGLVFVFMKVGLENETYPTSYSGGYQSSSLYNRGSNLQQTTYITGYQASSQVPIPVEYSNFVELGEFVNAVTLIRMHREQQQMQQKQNEKNGRIRRRRLEEDDKEEDKKKNNKDDAEDEIEGDGKDDAQDVKEEDKAEDKAANDNTKDGEDSKSKEDSADELDNVVDKAWEKAIQKNPEMKKQQQKANLLKVHHVPFFWHIPRTGGTTLSTLLSICHNLVQATSSFSSPPVHTREVDDAAFASRFRDPTLYVVRTHGQQFVNVDLDSYEGVQRAVKGDLIEKELADVVVVPDVRLGGLLFGSDDNNGQQQQQQQVDGKKEYKGVLFAMFRHPIDRAVSLFYHKQNVKDSIHYDPTLEKSSLQEWINSPSYVTDYMVRTLVGKIDMSPTDAFHIPVPLTPSDLDVAKEILRRKCIIGLLEEKGESMKRFDKFFGWRVDVSRDSLLLFEEDEKTAHAKHAARWSKNVKDEECSDKLLHWNWMNKNKHPSLDEGSVVYNLLESKNRYDMELYMYARQLFEEQFFQLGFDDDTINDNEVEWG